MKRKNILKNLKPLDVVIIFALLLTSVVTQIAFFRNNAKKTSIARVNAAGIEYVFSLKTDGEFFVKGAIGESVLQVKDGKIRIAQSPCPNKTCVNQGFVDSGTLICLPNKITVSIEGKNENKIDAVSK